ncbi:MAG: 4-alpha-glucanotransferase [Clostridia bacterium]|nr:4-alpha-glucanotransferase [Clostridia bacterium]
MVTERKSGVLMHVSSLNGKYGCGGFGKEARNFVDLLSRAGFRYWQILPISMTDEHNSPYRSPASLCLNPYFLDLESLFDKGYISNGELLAEMQNSPYLCEFDRLKESRLSLLAKAAQRAQRDNEIHGEITAFFDTHPEIEESVRAVAIREANGGLPWQEWQSDECDEDTLFKWKFIEHELYCEWFALKEYANSKGIKIIGDLPIYVAPDSVDVYMSPADFLLDESGYPTEVAGVPPDYFSSDGQLWGNPLYNFKKMRRDGYAFWRKRLSHAFSLFDGVRIDHFRAIEAYWSIPKDSESARCGRWVKGPGKELIRVIREVAGDKSVIAEDLGDITDSVRALLDYSGFPGMRVLQFAFLGDDNSHHLPHNYDKNSVVYTGTHDNNTLLGYVWELDAATRERVFDYFGYHGSDFDEACRVIIKSLLSSPADTVILPIQDILGFGADTRMNTPGRAEGNWAYRVTGEQLASVNKEKFKHLNRIYGRI